MCAFHFPGVKLLGYSRSSFGLTFKFGFLFDVDSIFGLVPVLISRRMENRFQMSSV